MAVKYKRYWDADAKKYKYRQISGFNDPKKTAKQIYEDSLKTDYKGFAGSGTTSAKERKQQSRAKAAQKKTASSWNQSRAQGQATKKADRVQFHFDNFLAPKKLNAKAGVGKALPTAKAGVGKALPATDAPFDRNKTMKSLMASSAFFMTPLGGSKTGPSAQMRYIYATDDELKKYASLSGKEQSDYLKELDSILDKRLGEDAAKYLKGIESPAAKNIATTATGFVGGYDEAIKGIEQVGRGILGDEKPVQRSAMGEAQKIIAPTLEGGAKVANDIAFSGGQMTPAILAGIGSGGLGLAPVAANAIGAGVTGVTSAGSTYGNTVEEGYSPEQARLYSVINGALEAGLQYALGGIKGVSSGGILKGVAGDLSKKLAGTPAVVQKIASVAASAGDEFTEEWLQGVIDSFVRNSVLGEENDINPFTWDKIYQGLIGAVMGGGTNVPSAIATPALDAQLGTDTMDAIKAENAGRAMGTVDVNTPEGRSAMVEDIEQRAQAFDAADNTFYDGKKATVEGRVGEGFFNSTMLGDIKAAREQAIAYAKTNFPKKVHVKSNGMNVDISTRGIKSFMSNPLNAKDYSSFFSLPGLIENAEVIKATPPVKAKTGIKGETFLKSSFEMNGTPYEAIIHVRNTDLGNKYKSHRVISGTVDDIKIEPAQAPGYTSRSEVPFGESAVGSNNNIPLNRQNVNTPGVLPSVEASTPVEETTIQMTDKTPEVLPNAEQAGETGAAQGTVQEQAVAGAEGAEQEVKIPTRREAGMKTGKATVIYSPYAGTTPQNNGSVRQRIEIDKDALQNAQNEIKNSESLGERFKGTLTSALEKVFGSARQVPINNVSFDGNRYLVDLNKNLVKKVVSDPNVSAEKLSLIYALDDVVKNGEFVGSGNYNKNNAKKKFVTRYDYFETDVNISGEPYVAAFDVEVLPDRNNFKTYKVVIENIDLQPELAAYTDPESAAETNKGIGLNQDITQPEGKVNTAEKSQTARQKETDNSNKNETQYSIARKNRQNVNNTQTAAPGILNLMDIHNQIKNGAAQPIKGLPGDSAGFLKALGEKSGVHIEIGPIYQNGVRVRGAEGRYDAAANTIRFSPEATRADVVRGVAMHELTHSIESSGDYGAYRDFALEYMFGGDGAAYDAAITAKQAQYAGDGIYLSPEAAEKEVIAEFTRDTLFADEEAASRLVRSNPSIARRIYEAIRAAIQKIKAYFGNADSIETLELERGRKLFERALGRRGTTENGKLQFSKGVFPDGENYTIVDTDQHLFDGVELKKYPKVAKRIILNKYKGQVIGVEPDNVYVNRTSANEYAYPAKRNSETSIKNAKMKVSTELHNLVETGKKIRHENDDGRHPEAIGGWDKYTSTFRIGDRFFQGELSVMITKRGRVFYDMTKIKDITNGTIGQYGGIPQAESVPNTFNPIILLNGQNDNKENNT